MPELPEVETIRRQIKPRLVERTVLEADSHPSAKFTPARDLVGARIVTAGRRGKFLLFPTNDEREAVVHLGMTGSFLFAPLDFDPNDPHLRAWWRLSGDEHRPEEMLLYRDIRRFGRIRVVPAGEYHTIPALAHAGPEPFDPEFDGRRFWELLRRSRRRLKTQLLSQRPIAGVGNIYADEALWQARINPLVTRLGLDRATVLLDAIRDALQKGMDNGGTTLRDYRNVDGDQGQNQGALYAYGRGGLPCLRCGETLKVAPVDARTTTWCPTCQRR